VSHVADAADEGFMGTHGDVGVDVVSLQPVYEIVHLAFFGALLDKYYHGFSLVVDYYFL
jgi:hypothetical protein